MTHRRLPLRLPLRLAALLAAVALLPWAPGADASTTDELQQTRDRIEQTIAELEQVDARAEQTEQQLAAAEERVTQLEEDLNTLLAQLDSQEQRVASARTRAEEAAAERDRIELLIGLRARRAFMGESPDPIVMLGAEGMEDVAGALDNLALLGALSARDNASIESLDVARVRADAAAGRLDAELTALEEVRAAREAVLDEAQQVLEERSEALASLEAEQERLMAEREDLEAEENEIQAIIAAQEEERRRAAEERRREQQQGAQDTSDDGAAAEDADDTPASSSPPPSSGCYQWPANGPVTSEYGPRWGRMHRGLDIDGDTGDALVAAQSGTVSYTGYYSGYGNLTLISHSDGVTTAYAHQSSIGVGEGQVVQRGEFIGRMGATGNVTGSHLHFETRTSSGAKNPRNYLC